jgi:hypothetical protein
MISSEICNCPCHNNNNVRHIMPCCFYCEFCSQKIKYHHYTSHIKVCEEKLKSKDD